MKKVLLSLVLVLVIVISCMSAWADVDLTGMSLDELKALTPYHVYFTDGTEADIPSSYQYTSTFTM